MKKTKTEEMDEEIKRVKNSKNTKQKRKNKKKKKRVWPIVLLFILLIIVIAVGIFAYRVTKLGGGVSGMMAATLGHDEHTRENLDPITVLVLGKSQNLTDTIMLVTYNPKNQEASMLSIPRDTFIGDDLDEATAWDKINSVYQLSVDDLLEDVTDLTGIEVKNYVMVDTQAFRELVDAIGGVTFNVPIDMKYDSYSQGLHIDLKAGEQLLNGDQAEQVVRFRHNNDGTTYPASYGLEDEGRMKTQQAFLTELAKQTLQFKNVTKITEIIDIANKYVKTNMDFNMLKDYAPYAIELDVNNIKKETLPGEPLLTNGVWVYAADEEAIPEIMQELFPTEFPESNTDETNTIGNDITNEITDTSSDISDAGDIEIELLNGTNNIRNLSKVSNALEDLGYNVTKTGNTNISETTVIINRNNISSSFIDEIKQVIEKAQIQSGGETNVDITIIIGQDYEELTSSDE